MRKSILVVPLVAAVLGGCSSEADKPASSQVVATVNGDELTSMQLDERLQAVPAGFDRRNADVQRNVLSASIDELLFKQRAIEEGLDKTPAVSRAIERARDGVLAKAYLDKIAPRTPPSEVEVSRFYTSKPYLFAQRREYDLTDVSVAGTPAETQPYVEAFKRPGTTLDSLIEMIRNNGVEVVPTSVRVTADQLPDKLALGLARQGPGDNVNYSTGNVQHFVRIDAVRPNPVPLDLARPRIAAALQNERVTALLGTEAKRLRQTAEIEYGDLGRKIQSGELAKAAEQAPPSPAGRPKDVNKTIGRGASGL